MVARVVAGVVAGWFRGFPHTLYIKFRETNLKNADVSFNVNNFFTHNNIFVIPLLFSCK